MSPTKKKQASATPPEAMLQLKVVLADLEPPVWRRVLVPAEMSLAQLHAVLQIAMGWTDSHLHRFEIDGEEYGRPDHMDGVPMRDERRVPLSAVLGPRGRARYEYDFGDGWLHELRVEKAMAATEGVRAPRCLDGARACPPEDCGGPHGYLGLLDALADPKHEDHAAMVDWSGELDPEAFDLDEVNRELAALGAKKKRTPRRRAK